jgi:molybdenum cofactor cytidylyltransferase
MLPGVVLAAGESRRMGTPKAMLPVGAGCETFVERIVATLTAAGVEPLVVVTGRHTAEIRSVLMRAGAPAMIVENPRVEEGQLSSLLVGIDAIDGADVEGALVTLVDVPLVSRATVACLIEAFRSGAAPIVRPMSRGRHGHPVIFRRTLFGELRAADLRVGAKDVVRRHAAEILDVEIDDEGAFVDVDTPEEYRRVFDRDAPGGLQ